MREAFSDELVKLVQADPRVYLLSGDHGYALFDALRKEEPQHFINAGVAEQNMVGVGAGMSKIGFYPIMYGLSAFVPIRVLEQIKIDFCYENLPGLFIGDGAGVVYSYLGASHQSTEDIAALMALPNICILSPADKEELLACFRWAIRQHCPVYMRIGKADLGTVHKSKISELSLDPLPIYNVGCKHGIYATGAMVKICLDLIQQNKIVADLYSVPILKSSKALNITKTLKNYRKVFAVEEHSIHGGLGDLICAAAAEAGGVQVRKLGIADKFSSHCGSYEYLMQAHGLDSLTIADRILNDIGQE